MRKYQTQNKPLHRLIISDSKIITTNTKTNESFLEKLSFSFLFFTLDSCGHHMSKDNGKASKHPM